MEQRGSRRGKEKADAATIPKIAGPGRKGSPEFVFGGRIAVEQDMLAAAGVVKVQNGGLSRSRQPRTFRVLQGGNQFDGASFITGGQYRLRVSSHGQAGSVSRFHAGNRPFRPFVIGNQVFSTRRQAGSPIPARAAPAPIHFMKERRVIPRSSSGRKAGWFWGTSFWESGGRGVKPGNDGD